MNLRHFAIIVFTIITLSSCTSFQTSSVSDSYSNRIESDNLSSERIPTETPAEFESRMEGTISPATWTTHDGTLRDPIPVGEYGEWGIYNENRFLNERTDYTIRMNVNYSIRGTEALRLYNDFNYNPSDYFYVDYRPSNGYELIIINISVQIDSKESIPAILNPLSFMLSTASGLGISTNDPHVAYSRFLPYYNIFAGDVYPGAKITANLVYEVPINQDIIIGFTDVWFRTNSEV